MLQYVSTGTYRVKQLFVFLVFSWIQHVVAEDRCILFNAHQVTALTITDLPLLTELYSNKTRTTGRRINIWHIHFDSVS